ncbi:nuclear transport factor 2 family protein [Methylobrevis albus]|uniref:Nuclear transport factor 2 family protein n=1 Tax=Methylobrevis albus TaxID=2793297 RepID=A0A931HZR2_9HYPH|nr:nuclear transport factor 2 family protein [Methylobrevis albus]MBH0236611.1 nuclear transport factor 2 family protein [Methylobrevis albus]
MQPDLPDPIRRYVEANSILDADAMLAAFAPDAVVGDEARRHVGHDEIRAWIDEATIANQAVVTPTESRQDGDVTLMTGRVEGTFPGSPVTLTFRFTLRGDAITGLEIA